MIADHEAELRDSLVVHVPHPLRVAIAPPMSKDGDPWIVEVVELSPQRTELVARGVSGPDGVWTTEKCAEDVHYSLNVKTANGDSYWSENFQMEPGAWERAISLETTVVHGMVRLGQKPLSAKLQFGGKYGGVSISTESNDEGEFAINLPRLGKWEVSISAEDPVVRSDVNVSVGLAPSGKDALCRIVLPNTTVAGEIVDERGSPVDEAILTVSDPEGALRQDTVNSGMFRWDGLSSGKLSLRAQTRNGDSDVSQVELREDADPPFVRLIVRDRLEISGSVVSASGRGVPRALIVPFPAQDDGVTFLPRTSTDADGAFTLFLPPRTEEIRLLVLAPGFSLRALRLGVQVGQKLLLSVEQDGGSLVVTTPKRPVEKPSEIPYLFHNGCFFPLTILAHLGWASRSISTQNVIRLPSMEVGEYSVCLIPERQLPLAAPYPVGVCARGVVFPFTATTLDVQPPAH